MKIIIILVQIVFLCTLIAQVNIELNFEDYNDHDVFNNFSGNTGVWRDEGELAEISYSFDSDVYHGSNGLSIKFSYSFQEGGWGGIWNSLIGKVDTENPDVENNQYMDFTDMFGDLNNSTNNPSNVEDVNVIAFKFWAKGSNDGIFDHNVKIEFKDVYGVDCFRMFEIPDTSDWVQYIYPVSLMNNVDLTGMKEMVITVAGWQNDDRTSYFYLDDLTFEIDESEYDASNWTNDEFLDLISHRAFNYFQIYTDELDFALDRSTFADMVSVGAIGFQLAAYCIGDSRDWADGLENRIENILLNLTQVPEGGSIGNDYGCYKGFFYHFLDANTGKRKDDKVELSLYDTMLLMYGVLTAKEYFPHNSNIQEYADSLYNRVEWDWMVDSNPGENQNQFHLGWKPEEGFLGYVDGYTDEALLVDILALGSDTYPITMDTYNARSRYFEVYPESSSDEIATAWSGSLFNYFFASNWLNLEPLELDKHSSNPINIWENNKRAIIANRQFCIDNEWAYSTYGINSWGLTACDNLVDPSTNMLSEYYAFGALPTEQVTRDFATQAPHVGTIPVYGAGSSITFLPTESINALRNYYSVQNLWCPLFGFGDAYSTAPHTYLVNTEDYSPIFDVYGDLIIYPATWLNGNWVNNMKMSIDEGPMLLAIENYRSNLIWEALENNSNIKAGLKAIFDYSPTITSITDVPDDQGRQVQVIWDRAFTDDVYSQNNFYSIWRLDDVFRYIQPSQIISDPIQVIELSMQNNDEKYYWQRDEEIWAFIEQIPALLYSQYSYIAPTLKDSTVSNLNYSTFKIVFHDPINFYESKPDSGYSVDNIPPNPVENLNIGVNETELTLTWQEVTEGSLNGNSYPEINGIYYKVYASDIPYFECDENTYITTVDDTNIIFDISDDDKKYYKIVVTD